MEELRLSPGRIALLAAAVLLLMIGLTMLVGPDTNSRRSELEQFVLEPIGRASTVQQVALAQAYRDSMLFGGKGKVTTGTSVDGRPTVPGLQTDCIPGVLGSDCSPAQEDGAWSAEAERFLDSRTAGAHSKGMAAIQADIDAGYAARDKFLQDCLKDPAVCTGRRTDDSIAARMSGNYGDTPTWGSRSHPWAPEQGADYGQYNNDGHWKHIPLPSGAKGDGIIVSDSYYADALNN